MFLCRACLTSEDDLFPMMDYQKMLEECFNGVAVEATALICPTCIRKLAEAHAFRAQAIESNRRWHQIQDKRAIEDESRIIKEEPQDEDFEGNIATNDIESPRLQVAEVFIEDDELKEPQITIEKLKKPKSLIHSIRAKNAWTDETRENLIKDCPFCFYASKFRADLMEHIREHVAANGGYECAHCSKKFMKKRSIKEHLHRVYFGNKDPARPETAQITCTACNEEFPRKSLLRVHIREKHPHQLAAADEAKKAHECKECGLRFSRKRNLDHHALGHSGLRPFICDVCGKSYKTREGLKYHQLTHTDHRFVCAQCGRGFKTKDHLRDHEPIHSGNFKFGCELCGKKFRTRNLLVGHRVVHDNTLRFTCDACGLKFRRANNLRDHKLSHSENRAFCCRVCRTTFKSRSSLKRHLRQHAAKMGLDESAIVLSSSQAAEKHRVQGTIAQQPKPSIVVNSVFEITSNLLTILKTS